MSAPALTYDNLPPHSALLREYTDDSITITAAAREPDPHLKRGLLRRAAPYAAVVSALLLFICGIVFGPMAYAHRNFLPGWTGILAAVFSGLLFVFVWRVRYFSLIDETTRALSGNTILTARPEQFLIEFSDASGTLSWDLSPSQIQDISVTRNVRRGVWLKETPPLDGLRITVRDGPCFSVLVGREISELRWVARTLKEFFHLA